jgi:hypothetical protein
MSGIPIRGVAGGSADAAFATARRRGAKRPDFTHDYFTALYADATARRIDADVLVAQWDLETGAGASAAWVNTGNPAGLGIFDDGSTQGLTFSPQQAARAHVTHMARYLGLSDVPADWIETDARWQAVADAGFVGRVSTTADLGNGLWATDADYARKLRERYIAYWGEPTTRKEKTPVTTPTIPDGWQMYNVAGLSTPIALPVQLIIDLIPTNQLNQRPGIRRQLPGFWVQHETGNANPGADAAMHNQYMHNGAEGQQLGYHFTTDDNAIYQMIPVDEVAWQAADGGGPGNMSGISNELCINRGINHAKARNNAEALAAGVLGSLGLGVDRVKRHWDFNFNSLDRHHCPDQMMSENYWPTFVENVGKLLGKSDVGEPILYPWLEADEAAKGLNHAIGDTTVYYLPQVYTAIRRTPRLRQASSKEIIGPPIAEGASFKADYVFRYENVTYVLTPYGTRIRAAHLLPKVQISPRGSISIRRTKDAAPEPATRMQDLPSFSAEWGHAPSDATEARRALDMRP